MSATNNDHFYSNLPLNEMAISKLVANEQLFSRVPEDWHIVITDIKQSTQAIEEGLHQVVNLVATGSIIAALNIAREANIAIPFFFGGDGATLLTPGSLLDPIMSSLTEHSENTSRNFNLQLRVGHMPVAEIYQKERQLHISKVRMSEEFSIPVVLGDGLGYAEQLIKKGQFMPGLPKVKERTLNLEGMECRWDKIKPPEDTHEVVCLLVEVQHSKHQPTVFKKVLDTIDEIFGSYQDRNPISVRKLKLKATLGKIKAEMKTKLGQYNFPYLVKNWLSTSFGKFYLAYGPKGRKYLHRLVELSDTLIIDGKINTVISGTSRQREKLISALDHLENNDEIIFGWHVSSESVMSCYVRDRLDQHIHFVDGSGGGYTQAAGMLKKKSGKLKRE